MVWYDFLEGFQYPENTLIVGSLKKVKKSLKYLFETKELDVTFEGNINIFEKVSCDSSTKAACLEERDYSAVLCV